MARTRKTTPIPTVIKRNQGRTSIADVFGVEKGLTAMSATDIKGISLKRGNALLVKYGVDTTGMDLNDSEDVRWALFNAYKHESKVRGHKGAAAWEILVQSEGIDAATATVLRRLRTLQMGR